MQCVSAYTNTARKKMYTICNSYLKRSKRVSLHLFQLKHTQKKHCQFWQTFKKMNTFMYIGRKQVTSGSSCFQLSLAKRVHLCASSRKFCSHVVCFKTLGCEFKFAGDFSDAWRECVDREEGVPAELLRAEWYECALTV